MEWFRALVSGSSMSRASSGTLRSAPWIAVLLVVLLLWAGQSHAMTADHIARLRQETVDMFYHGYDNYMEIAFPEDEVGAIPVTTAQCPIMLTDFSTSYDRYHAFP